MDSKIDSKDPNVGGFIIPNSGLAVTDSPGGYTVPASQTSTDSPGGFHLATSQTSTNSPGGFHLATSQPPIDQPGGLQLATSLTPTDQPGGFHLPSSANHEQIQSPIYNASPSVPSPPPLSTLPLAYTQPTQAPPPRQPTSPINLDRPPDYAESAYPLQPPNPTLQPHQSHHYGQSEISNTTIYMHPSGEPRGDFCVLCQRHVTTYRKKVVSPTAWIFVIILLFIFWPLAWVPLLFMHDEVAVCSLCNKQIGSV